MTTVGEKDREGVGQSLPEWERESVFDGVGDSVEVKELESVITTVYVRDCEIGPVSLLERDTEPVSLVVLVDDSVSFS